MCGRDPEHYQWHFCAARCCITVPQVPTQPHHVISLQACYAQDAHFCTCACRQWIRTRETGLKTPGHAPFHLSDYFMGHVHICPASSIASGSSAYQVLATGAGLSSSDMWSTAASAKADHHAANPSSQDPPGTAGNGSPAATEGGRAEDGHESKQGPGTWLSSLWKGVQSHLLSEYQLLVGELLHYEQQVPAMSAKASCLPSSPTFAVGSSGLDDSGAVVSPAAVQLTSFRNSSSSSEGANSAASVRYITVPRPLTRVLPQRQVEAPYSMVAMLPVAPQGWCPRESVLMGIVVTDTNEATSCCCMTGCSCSEGPFQMELTIVGKLYGLYVCSNTNIQTRAIPLDLEDASQNLHCSSAQQGGPAISDEVKLCL